MCIAPRLNIVVRPDPHNAGYADAMNPIVTDPVTDLFCPLVNQQSFKQLSVDFQPNLCTSDRRLLEAMVGIFQLWP